MECLYCGDCCLRMSPISNPCPHILIDGDFIFCGIYSKRPEQCKKHEYPFRFCPIGIEKLRLKSLMDVSMRIDAGWEKIQSLFELKEDKNDIKKEVS